MELVPIKVKIGLKEDGHAKYPQFIQLLVIKDSNMDWSKYVDVFGLGWHYDKTSGHKEVSDDSPYGMQWGVLIVPKEFADEAVTTFPGECIKLTEVELEIFYDSKAHAHEPEESLNVGALEVYEAIENAGGTLTPGQRIRREKALDVNNAEPGITKNLNKRWADYKAKMDVTIIQ